MPCCRQLLLRRSDLCQFLGLPGCLAVVAPEVGQYCAQIRGPTRRCLRPEIRPRIQVPGVFDEFGVSDRSGRNPARLPAPNLRASDGSGPRCGRCPLRTVRVASPPLGLRRFAHRQRAWSRAGVPVGTHGLAREPRRAQRCWYPRTGAPGRAITARTEPKATISRRIRASAPPAQAARAGITTVAVPPSLSCDQASCNQAKLALDSGGAMKRGCPHPSIR